MDSLTKGFEPSFVRVALDLLADDDWLDATREMGTQGPVEVMPLQKALQEVRGWPVQASDAAVVAALIAALDVAIASTPVPTRARRRGRVPTATGRRTRAGRLDGLLAQQLAGRRCDRGERVRALVAESMIWCGRCSSTPTGRTGRWSPARRRATARPGRRTRRVRSSQAPSTMPESTGEPARIGLLPRNDD
jgi:hypothetical protein